VKEKESGNRNDGIEKKEEGYRCEEKMK